MDDLANIAGALQAASELRVVRDIRGAIRVNLLQQGGREGPLGNIENPKPPPSLRNYGEQQPGRIDAAPQQSTQVRIVEAPPARVRTIETVCHCEDRTDRPATIESPARPPSIVSDQTLVPSDAERASGLPSRHDSPLVPPWRMPMPVAPPASVKCGPHRADHPCRGSMLDTFV